MAYAGELWRQKSPFFCFCVLHSSHDSDLIHFFPFRFQFVFFCLDSFLLVIYIDVFGLYTEVIFILLFGVLANILIYLENSLFFLLLIWLYYFLLIECNGYWIILLVRRARDDLIRMPSV